MLALIAGRGALPEVLVQRLKQPPVICAMQPFLPDSLAVDIPFRLEQFGSLLADLKARDVDEICMVGAVGRPPIDPTMIDAATMPFVPVLQAALTSGDDRALGAIIGILTQSGFTVRAAHDVAPDLLMRPGCETLAQPDDSAQGDVIRGAEVVTAMASADIGQACVVHRGQALAIEGAFGTDWMLASLSQRPDGQGGLLFKVPKPGQDRRADLPTIGPATVAAAAAAGLSGIVIEAGGVIVLDQARVIDMCNQHGLFLWVRDDAG